jgi:spore coat polysaccharide biosynthesis protein SpsF (cytidylyltransferase family)
VIQARYGSTRLPGKVLMPIKGVPLIQIAYTKAVEAFGADNVIVAYPKTVENLPLSMFLASHGMHAYAHEGDEQDVLGRFFWCATWQGLKDEDIVFRYTPDDHLKSPEMMKRVASGEKGIPIEIGGECFTMAQLSDAHHDIKSEFKREHITYAFSDTRPMHPPPSQIWTIDTLQDYEAANAA